MRKQNSSVHALCMYHPESLEIVVQSVTNNDRIRINKIVERRADSGKGKETRTMVFKCYARESGIVVTA
jgi:hypothetical protein